MLCDVNNGVHGNLRILFNQTVIEYQMQIYNNELHTVHKSCIN